MRSSVYSTHDNVLYHALQADRARLPIGAHPYRYRAWGQGSDQHPHGLCRCGPTMRNYLRRVVRKLGTAFGHNVSHRSAHAPELKLARQLENVGVSAYPCAAPLIDTSPT